MGKNSLQTAERLPPHSDEAEGGVLGCCLLDPLLLTTREARQLVPEAFYDPGNRRLWTLLRDMAEKRDCIDLITVQQRLRDGKILEEVGGMARLAALPDQVPSAANFDYYCAIVREKLALRVAIRACTDAASRAFEWRGGMLDFTQAVAAELEIASGLLAGKADQVLKVWRAKELEEYEVPAHLRLVGDSEISMGYDAVTVIAGPGGSGKSLVTVALALCGAGASEKWMGRFVHRRFKSLILQAENGVVRLKRELEAIRKNHPELNIDEHIFISDPPQGGLRFQDADFRASVRDFIERHKIDLVIVDPWSQVAVEDAAKEVVDKIAEIRSCFPQGDACPGLVIVAHTKKPRPEDVRRGRSLVYLVSGTIALTNCARTVYLLLPWVDDLEDERIYWACVKLNNGEMYSPSVWRRRFGTVFDHDAVTDPATWGQVDDEEGKRVTETDLRGAFGGETVLQKSVVAKRLERDGVCSYQTGMRVISEGRGGYLAHLVEKTVEGWMQLKEAK